MIDDPSKEPSDKKSPGFWFFTSDFEKDMQILPLAAQGLWIRMMCWAHENEIHRGFLELPTGEPMTEFDIAHRVGKPIKEVRAALDAMRRLGTFSEDARRCIFSRRMARDTHISEVRRRAALKRASVVDRAKDGKFAPANSRAKPEQNPSVSDSDSASDTDSVKEAAAANSSVVEISPPPQYKNGRNPIREIMEREVKLHEFAKSALVGYPGAQALYGSPDDVVIGKCLALCRGHPGHSEEECLSAALRCMAKARKAPGKSWMWFPTVMKQYLEVS